MDFTGKTVLITGASYGLGEGFAHGFAKSEKANVSATELKALKRLAEALLGLTPAQVAAAVEGRELIEVVNHGDD